MSAFPFGVKDNLQWDCQLTQMQNMIKSKAPTSKVNRLYRLNFMNEREVSPGLQINLKIKYKTNINQI